MSCFSSEKFAKTKTYCKIYDTRQYWPSSARELLSYLINKEGLVPKLN